MLDVSVEIDRAAVARLDGLLRKVAKECPHRLATETRRAALYICQSLKSRTKTAPKRIRPREYAANVSAVPPKYIHSKSAHHKLLRRWTLARKIGTPDAYANHYYVYTDRHRGKNGRMVGGDKAAEKRKLLRQHGGIPRAGLAKKSWGWIAQKIYSASGMGDLSWKRTRGERRDPRKYVNGVFSAIGGDATATISNRLDYALDALKPGALSGAITAATKRLAHNVEKHIERAAS